MSKTYDENVRKAQALAQGIRNNAEKAAALGITTLDVEQLLSLAGETQSKSTELDELRRHVAEKASDARHSLDCLTDSIRNIKKIIKTNVDQPLWPTFGIEDKR